MIISILSKRKEKFRKVQLSKVTQLVRVRPRFEPRQWTAVDIHLSILLVKTQNYPEN